MAFEVQKILNRDLPELSDPTVLRFNQKNTDIAGVNFNWDGSESTQKAEASAERHTHTSPTAYLTVPSTLTVKTDSQEFEITLPGAVRNLRVYVADVDGDGAADDIVISNDIFAHSSLVFVDNEETPVNKQFSIELAILAIDPNDTSALQKVRVDDRSHFDVEETGSDYSRACSLTFDCSI